MPRSSILNAATVSVQAVWLLAAGARAREVDVGALLARHGLSEALGADVDARVPAAAVLALWAELPELTRLPHFGIWLAELACAAPATSLGAHLVQSAPTLGVGLSRLIAFERVFHGVQATSLVTSETSARFTHQPPVGIGAGARPAIEFAFAWMLGTARHTTGVALAARCVNFCHPAPADTSAYERAFGVTPRFQAAENAFELDRSSLELPQRTADVLLGRLMERHARALAQQLPTGAGPVARVRGLLSRHLTRGDSEAANLAGIARELGMPDRTLQRRLAAEGTSFAALLDEVRRDLAFDHLADPSTSVAEVAFALGFGDQAAFHRAFVRWTGSTPGEHKKRLRVAPEANTN
jgi:AraC-like DNA-binding protein